MNKKTVFQIAIGEIPEKIQGYMLTVQKWAEKNGYEYKVITEQPEKLKGLSPRIASDWMRIELLIENPYSCFVDWGIEIKDEIILGDDPLLFPFFDQFVYNGNNTELFKSVYRKMIERKIKSRDEWKVEEGTIYKAFRTVYYEPEWMKCDINKYLIHYNVSKL
jgi:hypothetical protein